MASRRRAEMQGAERAGDDLTRVSGVGPVVAGRLAAAGIRTYRELAERTPEQLAAILVGLPACSPTRIASRDWTGQARALAGLAAARGEAPDAKEPVEPTTATGTRSGAGGPAAPAVLRLLRLGLTGAGSRGRPLDAGEPAAISLELRPGSDPPPAATLGYTATVTGRRLGDDTRTLVAELGGVVEVARGVSHAAAGRALDSGVYQLEAVVEAFLPGSGPGASPLWSETVRGERLHVAGTQAAAAEGAEIPAGASL